MAHKLVHKQPDRNRDAKRETWLCQRITDDKSNCLPGIVLLRRPLRATICTPFTFKWNEQLGSPRVNSMVDQGEGEEDTINKAEKRLNRVIFFCFHSWNTYEIC